MDEFITTYPDYWIPEKKNGQKIQSTLKVDWIMYSKKHSKEINRIGRMKFR